MIKLQSLFIISVLIFTSFACREKRDGQALETNSDSSSKELGSEEYAKIQGIILKIIPSKEENSSLDSENDLYYVYNINQPEPRIGVEKNSDSKFEEDDLVVVMVNYENPDQQYIDGRGMIDQEVLYSYLKRADSSYYRMKEGVPFE